MPTQRLEEKRVEEHVGEGEREGEREKEHPNVGEKERESALAPPFICFFLPLSLPCANWAQPGVLFALPEVLTLVLRPSFDFPLFYFRGLFPSLSFSHHILDSCFLF